MPEQSTLKRMGRRPRLALVSLATLAAVVGSPGAASAATATGSPDGSLDEVQPGAAAVRVRGWAFDPDMTSSIDVHIYVDNRLVAIPASKSRPDVGAALPGFGPNHGFDTVVPAGPGQHTVCAYGINVGAGTNALIGCRVVVVGGSPIGSLDGVSQRPSGLHVRGWAADLDYAGPATLHIYLRNGVKGGVTGGPPPTFLVDLSVTDHTAGVARPDVAAALPAVGAVRGYEIDLPVVQGPNEACVYAINTHGVGEYRLFECRVVNLLDSVTYVLRTERVPTGVRFAGAAIDPRTAAPTTVTAQIGDQVVSATADLPVDPKTLIPGRFDGLEGYGPHGFDIVVPAANGEHRACVRFPSVPGTGSAGDWEVCSEITVTPTDVTPMS